MFVFVLLLLELLEKEVYDGLRARIVSVLKLQIFSRINQLESALVVYFNRGPFALNLELKMACAIMYARLAVFFVFKINNKIKVNIY